MPNGIRVIVTDIGSVLFKFDPERRFDLLSARTGIGRDELEDLLFTSGFETRCEAGEFSAEEIRGRVAEMTGFDGDTDELSGLWTAAFTVDEDVLATLTATDSPLAIFSNNGPLFADYFDVHFPEAAKWFMHRYFACRLRARKPTTPAYEAVETQLRAALTVRPDQILFVDDNRENTAEAVRRGWQVHTFTNADALSSVLATVV